jgi:dephospho-CoA kinase
MKLGVTGGIGSGKTTVCKVFNVLGIPSFLTDVEARILLDTNTDLKKKLNSIIGTDMYQTGILDRKKLANIIFNSKGLLESVNQIVHPLVFDNFRNWVALQESEYVIMESAILFESGAHELVDKTVSVVTPVEERIKRISQRNNLTKEQIRERIKNQITDEIRISMSDFVIYNNDKDMIIPAIIKIHNEIIESIKRSDL